MESYKFSLSSFFVVSLFLTGCGGGGGAKSSANLTPIVPLNPTTPPTNTAPPPPVNTNSLLDYSGNASTAALSTSEGVVQLASLAKSVTNRVSSTVQNRNYACSNGGTESFVLTDNDASNSISNGDNITATYRECELVMVNSVVDGSISIDVSDFKAGETIQVTINAGDLEFDEEAIFRGLLNIDFSLENAIETLTISADNELVLSFESQDVLSINNLALVKTENYRTAQYSISVSAIISDNVFDGSYELTQIVPWSGYISEYPNSGELQISAAGNESVTLTSNFVQNSRFVEITTSDNQSFQQQWLDSIEGMLFDFQNSVNRGSFSYYSEPTEFRADNFSFLGKLNLNDPQQHGLNEPLVYAFSRPIANTDARTDEYLRTNTFPYSNVPVIIEIDGAMLIITPQDALEANTEYSAPSFSVFSENDQSSYLSSGVFKTSDTIIPSLLTQTKAFRYNDTPWLDASNSTEKNGNTLSYEWFEVTDFGVIFSSPNSVNTNFIVPENISNDIIVAVRISNPNEYTITESATIQFISDTLTFLSYDSPVGDYIGQGQSVILTPSDGNFNIIYDATTPNYIGLNYNGNEWWNLDLASAETESLGVGSYENATRYPFNSPTLPGLSFSGSGRGCNQSTGRFDITEMTLSTSGEIESMVVNFEQSCENTNPPIMGRFVFNSASRINE